GTDDDADFYLARVLNDIALSSDELKHNSTIQIYPNPTSGQLIVSYAFSYTKPTTITIIDITGKIFYEEKVAETNSRHIMNVKNLPAGLYLLTLKTERESHSVKFVKE